MVSEDDAHSVFRTTAALFAGRVKRNPTIIRADAVSGVAVASLDRMIAPKPNYQ